MKLVNAAVFFHTLLLAADNARADDNRFVRFGYIKCRPPMPTWATQAFPGGDRHRRGRHAPASSNSQPSLRTGADAGPSPLWLEPAGSINCTSLLQLLSVSEFNQSKAHLSTTPPSSDASQLPLAQSEPSPTPTSQPTIPQLPSSSLPSPMSSAPSTTAKTSAQLVLPAPSQQCHQPTEEQHLPSETTCNRPVSTQPSQASSSTEIPSTTPSPHSSSPSSSHQSSPVQSILGSSSSGSNSSSSTSSGPNSSSPSSSTPSTAGIPLSNSSSSSSPSHSNLSPASHAQYRYLFSPQATSVPAESLPTPFPSSQSTPSSPPKPKHSSLDNSRAVSYVPGQSTTASDPPFPSPSVPSDREASAPKLTISAQPMMAHFGHNHPSSAPLSPPSPAVPGSPIAFLPSSLQLANRPESTSALPEPQELASSHLAIPSNRDRAFSLPALTMQSVSSGPATSDHSVLQLVDRPSCHHRDSPSPHMLLPSPPSTPPPLFSPGGLPMKEPAIPRRVEVERRLEASAATILSFAPSRDVGRDAFSGTGPPPSKPFKTASLPGYVSRRVADSGFGGGAEKSIRSTYDPSTFGSPPSLRAILLAVPTAPMALPHTAMATEGDTGRVESDVAAACPPGPTCNVNGRTEVAPCAVQADDVNMEFTVDMAAMVTNIID